MKTISKMLTVAAIIALTFSCKKNHTSPEEITEDVNASVNLIKIGETYITGAKAKAIIYSKKSFETGYNEVYVALYDSIDGSQLSTGNFSMTPMMDMGMMQHSSPVENTTDTIATNGYFKTAVVFSMPGNDSQWSLNLNYHNKKNNLTGTGTIGVNVISSTPARFMSTVLSLDSNSSVFVSLVGLTNPQVGINNFEITIHKKVNTMTYQSVNNYSVEIVPEMPSMGHGSPNNIDPVLTSNGHYVGKVNFTMTGLWKINLKLYKNGNLISNDQYFETTLQ